MLTRRQLKKILDRLGELLVFTFEKGFKYSLFTGILYLWITNFYFDWDHRYGNEMAGRSILTVLSFVIACFYIPVKYTDFEMWLVEKPDAPIIQFKKKKTILQKSSGQLTEINTGGLNITN